MLLYPYVSQVTPISVPKLPSFHTVKDYAKLHTGIGVSRLTYGHRSTQSYLRVDGLLGLHTGIGTLRVKYRYRSIWTCIQV